MPSKKSWHDKLHDNKDFPKVFPITPKMSQRWGAGTCVIPAPVEVDALMRAVRRGKLTTVADLRQLIARRHNATIACPITVGIFTWIAAHAADEAARAGQKKITPYWRTLKTGGELNLKFPGGPARLASLLRREGHSIARRGKRWFVEGYEASLAPLKP